MVSLPCPSCCGVCGNETIKYLGFCVDAMHFESMRVLKLNHLIILSHVGINNIFVYKKYGKEPKRSFLLLLNDFGHIWDVKIENKNKNLKEIFG